MRHGMAIDALDIARFRPWPGSHPGSKIGLIFPTDRGGQCASCEFNAVLKELGIMASMSREGNC